MYIKLVVRTEINNLHLLLLQKIKLNQAQGGLYFVLRLVQLAVMTPTKYLTTKKL